MSRDKGKLPRLPAEYYRGSAWVFWTHTLEDRVTGWLDDRFHAWFRECLLHAQCRERLVCPLYVLMPDHFHLLWMGLHATSDQRAATQFLRTCVNRRLAPARLQRQPHDHVLREEEREHGAYASTWRYIASNPERGGLVKEWREYPYLGSVIPGYPEIDPRAPSYFEDFWKILPAARERANR